MTTNTGVWVSSALGRQLKMRDGLELKHPMLFVGPKPVWFDNMPAAVFERDRELTVHKDLKPPTPAQRKAQDEEQRKLREAREAKIAAAAPPAPAAPKRTPATPPPPAATPAAVEEVEDEDEGTDDNIDGAIG